MTVESCDFLVLGAGPAGLAAALHAVALGRDVVLLEADPAHPALTAPPAGLRVLEARARLAADGAVVARLPTGEEVRWESAGRLLAVGDAPLIPADVALDGMAVASARTARLDPPSGSVLVAGGGPVGVAAAAELAWAGAAVTLAEQRERLLPGFDADLAAHVAARLAARGVTVRTGQRLLAARPEAGAASARLRARGGAEVEFSGARVLLALGRSPRTTDLGLPLEKVVVDRRGHIQTDPCQETAWPGLYAAGAVTGTPTTARTAAAEGRAAAAHAAGSAFLPVPWERLPRVVTGPLGPAAVGLDPAEAEARGHAAHTVAVARDDAFAKLVVDTETGLLLGAHLAGPRAAMDIEAAALLMAAGRSPDVWRDLASADGCLAAALTALTMSVSPTGTAHG